MSGHVVQTSILHRVISVTLAVFAMVALGGPYALANGDNSPRAIVKINHLDGAATVRGLRVALDKSVLLELPQDVHNVIVANPTIVDAVVLTSTRINMIGKTIGQSNAIFTDADGNNLLILEIIVEQDVAALEAMLHELIPGSAIHVRTLRDSVILTGSVRNPADAKRAEDLAARFVGLDSKGGGGSGGGGAASGSGGGGKSDKGSDKVLNMITVEAEEQVMLQVTVAEIQRSILKQFGINIGSLINSGNFVTSVLTENAVPLTAAAGLGTLPVPAIPTTGTNAGALSLFNQGPTGAGNPFGNSGVDGFWTTPRNNIAYAVRALERDGLIKTLAEPNLTAVSGEAAKFLAGGEFPIPLVDSQGQVTVNYKEFGIGLAFTPVVLSEERISLRIETEVSELSNQGAVTLSDISIPALKKREARSTVELPSGGSLALAGLLSEDVRQNIDGFPGLKDLPILGKLFRSRDFIKEETELVVIVTPYVVKAVNRRKLATPVDGLAPATDLRTKLLGHFNRIYSWEGPTPLARYEGDVGFILK